MQLAWQRLENQRLTGASFSVPEAAVRWLGCVQAQDYHGAKWALGLRTHGVDHTAVDRAFDTGAFIRIHVMRPTWHFVAQEDLRWVLDLTSPRVHAANAYMYRKLELNEQLFLRAHALFTAALEGHRALTRDELAGVLAVNGIPARGHRLAYIVMQAELAGVLCSGPMQGKQHTYALTEERVPPAAPLTRVEALATLALRYFQSHGPATMHDFAWWSGLTVSDARAGLELVRTELEPIAVAGKTYWTGGRADAVESRDVLIHLLPNYDEHVVAYKNHAHTLDPKALDALRTRTDRPLDVHLVTRNGLIIGGWKRRFERGATIVSVTMLVELGRRERDGLECGTREYGAFIGQQVALEIA